MSILLKKHFAPVQILSATSISDFQKSHTSITPGLIILGMNNEGGSDHQTNQSVKLVLECRTRFSDVPLIVFEDNYSTGSTSSYFQLGAKGHLLKKCTENEFVTCIARVLDNKYYLSPELHVRTLLERETRNFSNTFNHKNLLSLRELQIAIYLSKGEGTMSIANLVQCSPSAVSMIKKRILSKLEVNNTIELAGKLNGFSLT